MISGIAIALMLVSFAGIVGWAWSRQRERAFAEAAALALAPDDTVPPASEPRA
ncbi:MAG: CcoQ/FixQ family Cbb3-type cytochrome c oxidase assembly chaperone [Proteobacteria bacterium]|nr:CcoQ/FixQ family Cbb3-type cytochrome c oxidase assembly chaperone [Pseudomonadota bacterium]